MGACFSSFCFCSSLLNASPPSSPFTSFFKSLSFCWRPSSWSCNLIATNSSSLASSCLRRYHISICSGLSGKSGTYRGYTRPKVTNNLAVRAFASPSFSNSLRSRSFFSTSITFCFAYSFLKYRRNFFPLKCLCTIIAAFRSWNSSRSLSACSIRLSEFLSTCSRVTLLFEKSFSFESMRIIVLEDSSEGVAAVISAKNAHSPVASSRTIACCPPGSVPTSRTFNTTPVIPL
mmetsp:Transcript_20991/g.34210  ORF Transcript_20991/g.34210 Transcript_20991/m.34210 type:complete len:232 (+) Transcript_20991:5099-5794(+)